MSYGEHFDATEKNRSELREAVVEVGTFLAHLPGAATAAKNGLPESWAKLVKLLDVGSPLEVRRCPSCGAVGMRMATRCGQCWAALAPLESPSASGQSPGGVSEG